MLSYAALNLPPGLTIDPGMGIISGTVAYGAWAEAEILGGAFTPIVTVTAADTADGTAASTSISFAWTISLPAPVVSDPGSQTNSTGDTVSLQIEASQADGDPLTYAAAGLPDGLGIDPDSGLISGTIDAEAAAGSPFTVTVTATDDTDVAAPQTGSVTFSWVVGVGTPPIELADPGDQSDTEGDEVSLTISAEGSGGTLTFSAEGLPDGLSIDPGTGEISGTIATGAAAAGPFAPTITASDGMQTGSLTFTWSVDPVVTVAPLGELSNVDGDTVSVQVTASDATEGTLTYSATELPPGLGIDSSTGLITGTVSTTASADSPYLVQITVSDGINTTDQDFWWRITDGVTTPPTITDPGPQTSVVGDSVSLAVSASDTDDGTLVYVAVGLPDGLTMDPFSGVISGTVVEDALDVTPCLVTIYVTDYRSGLVTSQTFEWEISDSMLAVSADDLSAIEGEDVTLTVATFTDSDLIRTYDEYMVVIDWGDGTSDDSLTGNVVVSGADGMFTVTGEHVYPSAGDYSPVVSVSDGYQTVTGTGSATVDPAPLDVTGGFMQGLLVGSSATEDWASFTSGNRLSTADDFTATIDWGDGTSSTGTVAGVLGAFGVSGDHAYEATGEYIVTVTVQGISGVSGTVTSKAQVGRLYAGQLATLEIVSFDCTDPNAMVDQFSATIKWGDGTTSAGTIEARGSEFVVEGTHAYAEDSYDQPDRAYPVTVTVNGPLNGTITKTEAVTVERLPLAGVAGELGGQAGVALGGITVATFTVPDTADGPAEFTATINWGDGTASDGTVVGSGGMFQVTGGHTYEDAGTYPVQVIVSQAWSSSHLALVVTGAANIIAQPKKGAGDTASVDVFDPFKVNLAKHVIQIRASIAKNSIGLTVLRGPGWKESAGPYLFTTAMKGSGVDRDSLQFGLRYFDKNGNALTEFDFTNSLAPQRNSVFVLGANWVTDEANGVAIGAPGGLNLQTFIPNPDKIPKDATKFNMVFVYTDVAMYNYTLTHVHSDIPMVVASFTGTLDPTTKAWTISANPGDVPARTSYRNANNRWFEDDPNPETDRPVIADYFVSANQVLSDRTGYELRSRPPKYGVKNDYKKNKQIIDAAVGKESRDHTDTGFDIYKPE